MLNVMLKAKALMQDGIVGGICFICNDFEEAGDYIAEMPKKDCEQSNILSTLLSFNEINTCYKVQSINVIEKIMQDDTELEFFPPLYLIKPETSSQNIYESTMFLQQFFMEHQYIPYFKMKPEAVRGAIEIFDKYVAPSLPVVVHLKNNPSQANCSNARFKEWEKFIRMRIDTDDIKFILIGNEEVDKRIAELPNVIVTKYLGTTLAQELALVETAYAFMGMSSGPCNAAICSNIPYVIYKNPGHHTEAMDLELGDKECFNFASPHQKLLRIFETSDNLSANFNNILSNCSREAWNSRVSFAFQGFRC